MESFHFNHDGVDYSIKCLEEDSWDDQGKYQYGGTTYQLVSYDKNINGYCCNDSIVDLFDIEIYRPCTRSGSYFSDYYYQYHTPTIYRIITKFVPEVVIPAHLKVVYEEV